VPGHKGGERRLVALGGELLEELSIRGIARPRAGKITEVPQNGAERSGIHGFSPCRSHRSIMACKDRRPPTFPPDITD
jgi:hypothetical protein